LNPNLQVVDVDLKGDLAVFEPVTVFQLINFAQQSGRLDINGKENSAQVFFDAGNVVYAEIDERATRLGEYLVQNKVITQRALDGALVTSHKKKQLLGAVLLKSRKIKEVDLRGALEDQVKEVIYEVVRWRQGTFEFQHGQEPADQVVSIDIALDHLMLEGFKRMDEEEGQ
jgi:hypothetical protein